MPSKAADKEQKFVFPLRTIHLDFHTGPAVPDVGKDFDPETFARTFKAAHVDSVTVFAKCHHGHLYYATERAERHPSLPKDLDLLGQQIEALHKVGIRAPIYLSVQCDEYAANTHPEWLALTPELQQVKGGHSAFTPAWQILDMSSPYQDYLAEQLQEVLERFAPVDGIFLDMCWDQTSCSKWAIEGMTKRGYDPRLPEHRSQYAREVAHDYMKRYRDMVEAAHQKAAPAGVWFNSRPKTQLHIEKKFLRHVEIECLPTGGWGYAYFPYVARYVRSVANLPTLSHTGRFFKSWGDNSSLKPEAALKYECCQVLSQGMTGGVGDLLHPRGVPQPAVYDLIGRVYSYIEACEPYVVGGQVLSQIAVVVDPSLGDSPSASGIGAVRALQQLRHQFDIVPPETKLDKYELVIVPESTRVDENLQRRLQSYLQSGGALIVCGPAALDEGGQPILAELGIVSHGESPYTHTFLHAAPPVSEGLADYGYVMYERGFRMTAAKGAQNLVRIGEPYFQRTYEHFSGHEYTPEDKVSRYAGAIKNGNAITFAVPVLEAYGKHAAPNYRILLDNCIRLLLPQPLLKTGGPTKLETTVMRKGNSMVVHLLSFSPERRAEGLDIVEDAIPLVDVPVAVKVAKPPKRVFLAPPERDLLFTYEDGYVHTQVTVLDGHALLVINQ
ncbi:MAG: alpha-L-fucosidase [Abitibacteriaceae bacterium]|nr:alpha-L-fucosidase [Abditibacteriaceae bacterium]